MYFQAEDWNGLPHWAKADNSAHLFLYYYGTCDCSDQWRLDTYDWNLDGGTTPVGHYDGNTAGGYCPGWADEGEDLIDDLIYWISN